jgi:invasion protein IalB
MFIRILATVTLLLCFYANNASAQQFDKTYNDWSVYTITQSGKQVCYIASSPRKKTGTYKKRGEPYLLVTHISKTVDEVSASSGYPYKQGMDVVANVDEKKYNLFTKGELAWAYDSEQDGKMVTSMKAGKEMVIDGSSRLNTASTDTYSLKGFSAAYKRMKELCN